MYSMAFNINNGDQLFANYYRTWLKLNATRWAHCRWNFSIHTRVPCIIFRWRESIYRSLVIHAESETQRDAQNPLKMETGNKLKVRCRWRDAVKTIDKFDASSPFVIHFCNSRYRVYTTLKFLRSVPHARHFVARTRSLLIHWNQPRIFEMIYRS